MRTTGRNKPPFYITVYYLFICPKHDGRVANSVDPDQTQLSPACDLGTRCLPYMSKYGKYKNMFWSQTNCLDAQTDLGFSCLQTGNIALDKRGTHLIFFLFLQEIIYFG